MLLDVMAHYGLAKDFRHAGFFETEQHKRIFRQLKTAIPNGYLIAVSGIVGCGKTTTLRRLQERLRQENKVIVSKSLSVEKNKTTLKTLICALFYDVSGDKDYKVATVGEKRERELQELIRSAKKPVALFVDEAHDLHRQIRRKLELNTGRFPTDAVRAAIEQREAMTPVLLAALQEAAGAPKEIEREPRFMLHIYAMYLLAQFRERAAYPLLVKLFSTLGEVSRDITGDVVTEDLDRILASVCHDDLEPIRRMIENPAVNEYVRSACLQALAVLVAEEKLSREQVVDYFRSLFHGKLERDQAFLWSELVVACCDLYPEELVHDIKRAYDDGLVDPFIIGMDSVRDALTEGREETLRRSRRHRGGLIEDTVAEMKWWACFEENSDAPTSASPTMARQPVVKGKKIGRNDPCPCGSGKKYKKCCLH